MVFTVALDVGVETFTDASAFVESWSRSTSERRWNYILTTETWFRVLDDSREALHVVGTYPPARRPDDPRMLSWIGLQALAGCSRENLLRAIEASGLWHVFGPKSNGPNIKDSLDGCPPFVLTFTVPVDQFTPRKHAISPSPQKVISEPTTNHVQSTEQGVIVKAGQGRGRGARARGRKKRKVLASDSAQPPLSKPVTSADDEKDAETEDYEDSEEDETPAGRQLLGTPEPLNTHQGIPGIINPWYFSLERNTYVAIEHVQGKVSKVQRQQLNAASFVIARVNEGELTLEQAAASPAFWAAYSWPLCEWDELEPVRIKTVSGRPLSERGSPSMYNPWYTNDREAVKSQQLPNETRKKWFDRISAGLALVEKYQRSEISWQECMSRPEVWRAYEFPWQHFDKLEPVRKDMMWRACASAQQGGVDVNSVTVRRETVRHGPTFRLGGSRV